MRSKAPFSPSKEADGTFNFEDLDLSNTNIERSSLASTPLQNLFEDEHKVAQSDEEQDNLYDIVDVSMERNHEVPSMGGSMYKIRRRRRKYGSYCMCASIALLVLTLILMSRKGDDSSTSETTPAVHKSIPPAKETPGMTEIRYFLHDHGVEDADGAMETAQTPQYRAIHTMSELQVQPNMETDSPKQIVLFLAQYALLVLYYNTQPDDWSSPLNIGQSDNVCQWSAQVNRMQMGLLCTDDGLPMSLTIRRNQLQGSLPTEIGLLKSLYALDMYDNKVTGSIPSEICQLGQLREFNFGRNELKGTVPDCLGNLVNLQQLYLQENVMTGNFPREIEALVNLRILDLSVNAFTDDLPLMIRPLTNLRWLLANNNKFKGKLVPTTFESHRELEVLDISHNRIESDVFPDIIFELPNLGQVDLSHNHLHGEMPQHIAEQKTMVYLSLMHNEFGGKVSQGISNLKALASLYISNNHFTGQLPISMLNWESIEYFFAGDNPGLSHEGVPYALHMSPNLKGLSLRNCNLEGTLPLYLGKMTGMQLLDLADNKLEGTIPDNWGNLEDLQYLVLNGNTKLAGQLPDTFSKLTSLETMLVDNTRIHGDVNFMCDIMGIDLPNSDAIFVTCSDSHVSNCRCCNCCEDQDLACSDIIDVAIDDAWNKLRWVPLA